MLFKTKYSLNDIFISEINKEAKYFSRIGELLTAEAKHVEEECHTLAGTKFNLASSKQVLVQVLETEWLLN